MKKLLLSSITAICLAIAAFVYYLFNAIGQTAFLNTESIEIAEIASEDEGWIVKGSIDMDEETVFLFNKGFNGVEYQEEDGVFYLRLRYGVVSGEAAEDFEVYLENKLDNADEVFLRGNSFDDVKLIYKK